jgi:hypothetical protein
VVVRTYQKPAAIKVPQQLCMSWLRDPQTGGIRAEYADTFSLRGGPRAAS